MTKQERTIVVILDFQNGVMFQEVEADAGDPTCCQGVCEEIREPLDEVEVDAEEGIQAEREEVDEQEVSGIDQTLEFLLEPEKGTTQLKGTHLERSH